jgi:hypothetical protein
MLVTCQPFRPTPLTPQYLLAHEFSDALIKVLGVGVLSVFPVTLN